MKPITKDMLFFVSICLFGITFITLGAIGLGKEPIFILVIGCIQIALGTLGIVITLVGRNKE